jgi:hypothetical protein
MSIARILSIFACLLFLSSCLRPSASTGSAGTDLSASALAPVSGIGGTVAVSGNGEAYGGGSDSTPGFNAYFRSPGKSCSGGPLLGYSGSIVVPQGFIGGQVEEACIWFKDQCDPSQNVTFGDGATFDGVFQSAGNVRPDNSQVYWVANGNQIYERTDTPSLFSTGTYLNEAICSGSTTDKKGQVEVQLRLDPLTGARSVALYLTWYVDPYTGLPYDPVTKQRYIMGKYAWFGGTDTAFPVSRQDSGGDMTFNGGGFQLVIPETPGGGTLAVPDGSIRVNLFGTELDLVGITCTWSGQ